MRQSARRQRAQARLAPANLLGVRLLIKALRRGEAIGILPDQAPGVGEGEWVDFFGRPAYTMTLVSRLQASTGAAVVMVFAERLLQGAGYRMHMERVSADPLDPAADHRLDRLADVEVPQVDWLDQAHRNKPPSSPRRRCVRFAGHTPPGQFEPDTAPAFLTLTAETGVCFPS